MAPGSPSLVDALTDASLIPFVPLVAASIRAGDFTLISQATSLLTFKEDHSVGMFYSVTHHNLQRRGRRFPVTSSHCGRHPSTIDVS
jgi:hypothetical protein